MNTLTSTTETVANVPAATPARTSPRFWLGAMAGLVLFLLQNVAVWAGAISGKGSVPLYHLRNEDTGQYLAFLELARDHFLFPNLHLAWRTEPAMFNPLFLTGGKMGAWLGWSSVATLMMMEAVCSIGAGVALAWVFHTLLETRAQRVGAIITALLSMPLFMLVTGTVRFVAPGAAPLFWFGVIEQAYSSADGLARGGLSNSPTLTFGSTMMLLSLALAVARLRTGRLVYTRLLAGCVFLSALVHPFEVFVIVPAVFAGFLWLERAAWKETIGVGVAASAGLAPHVLLLLRHAWLRDLSQSFDVDMNFSRILLTYGIGFLAVPFLVMANALPRSKADKMLLLWWLMTIVICLLPGAPFPPHLLDGFALVTGILVVRLASQNAGLNAAFQKQRRAFVFALGLLLAMAAVSYAGMFVKLASDGRALDPEFLLNTVASPDEVAVLAKFRELRRTDDLVLAPGPLALLLVQAPMHSFASHPHLSLDYMREQAEAAKFFDHKMTDDEARGMLARYGVHWVVVPGDSGAMQYFAGSNPRFTAGRFQVFEFAGNRMNAYPGVAAIRGVNSGLSPTNTK